MWWLEVKRGERSRGEEWGYRKPQVCAGWRVGGLNRGQWKSGNVEKSEGAAGHGGGGVNVCPLDRVVGRNP